MQSYVTGEITITAAQLANAKAEARKEMRATVRSKDARFSLFDIFGFAFDHALESMKIGLFYNDGCMLICDSAVPLIVGSVEDDHALTDIQLGIWKKWRLDEDFATAALTAAVDEMLDASLNFLGIKVKAPQKTAKESRERARLHRAA